jgi:predicted S18 family serine protease
MKHYGINIYEVEDVNEALGYFTGYNFTMTGQDNNITTEGYIDSMKPLASSLFEESRALYENTSAFFGNSSIPNYYPDYQRTTLETALSDAKELIEKSSLWYNEGLYYSSISWSFQSLIYSRFVFYGCSYFNSDNGDRYIQSLLDDVTSFFENQSELAKNAEIKGMISLQCVGIAQSRAGEASSYISKAHTSFNNYDRLNALYRTAFAMERSKSVGWWLNISSNFIDSGNINVTSLKNLATEYRDDAQQAIIYSTVIIQEIGSSSNYLSSAEDLLVTATTSLDNDFPAAALFESLEALIKANLAIETIEIEPEDKIERASERASNSIGNSRRLGIEPVLAVSYYEYAYSLTNESSFSNALFYYKYSNIIAGALGLLTNFTGGGFSSRYIGIPETGSNIWSYLISTYLEYFVIFAILVGLIGFAFGLILATVIVSLKKDEKPEKKMKLEKIDEQYKRQSSYFSGDDIPRSIKDYYKKNK